MSVGKLVGFAASGESEDLVSEANPEDRLPERVEQEPHLRRQRSQVRGVAGSVADDDPIGFADMVGEPGVPGNPVNGRASFEDRSNDVVLDPGIHDEDPKRPASIQDGLGGSDLPEHFLCHVDPRRLRFRVRKGEGRREEPPVHRAPFSQSAGEGPRIDSGDRGHGFRAQPISERAATGMVAPGVDIALNDQTLDLDSTRFERPVDAFGSAGRRHSVAPYERVGADEDLTAIRGVGQCLDVAGHCRVENNFPRDGVRIAESGALELCPVFENELHRSRSRSIDLAHPPTITSPTIRKPETSPGIDFMTFGYSLERSCVKHFDTRLSPSPAND